MDSNIECKVCGSSAPADQFRLHYKYKQVVCPRCQSGKEPIKKEIEREIDPPKPVDWDSEDEYLEKISYQRKEENQAQFSKVAGTEQIKCTCSSCKYEFKYNPTNRIPRSCPYCNADIPKLRTSNLI